MKKSRKIIAVLGLSLTISTLIPVSADEVVENIPPVEFQTRSTDNISASQASMYWLGGGGSGNGGFAQYPKVYKKPWNEWIKRRFGGK